MSGYPHFPFDVDRDLDLWISGLSEWVKQNLRGTLRSYALLIREELGLLGNPFLPEVERQFRVQRTQRLRLEAYAVEVQIELERTRQDELSAAAAAAVREHSQKGGKVLAEKRKLQSARTRAKVKELEAKLRVAGKPERSLTKIIARELGIKDLQTVRDYRK
jgi:hypothetical protein